MKRINKPLAIIFENVELLEKIKTDLNAGISILHISEKYEISEYLIKRVSEIVGK